MFFQLGGGRKITEAQAEKETMVGGQKIHQLGQVVLVSRIQNGFCVCVCVSGLFYLRMDVWM